MQDCHGTTTLDSSGLSLAQLEQLLGQLQLPGLPGLTPTSGGVQNVTQQASNQSQTDGGAASQTQVAAQSNTTIQVAAGAGGEATGPAAVNHTAQGIWQLQIGCLFDCSGTQQLQQATQSNTTVQAVGSGTADTTGSSAVNTVIRIVWQLQVGCLFTCYDAVEDQSATGADSTVVVTPGPAPGPTSAPTAPGPTSAPTSAPAPRVDPAAAQPLPGDPPSDAPPMAPVPAAPPGPTPPASPPSPGTRGDGGAGVVGAALGLSELGRMQPVLRGSVVTSGSVSAATGGGESLVSMTASRSVAVDYARSAGRPAPHRELHQPVVRRAPAPHRTTVARARRAGVDPSAAAESGLAVALAAAVALALGLGMWRRWGQGE
jgi:hypothetical protein